MGMGKEEGLQYMQAYSTTYSVFRLEEFIFFYKKNTRRIKILDQQPLGFFVGWYACCVRVGPFVQSKLGF